MASQVDQKPSKAYIDARAAYERFIEDKAPAWHWMEVATSGFPRRRVDGRDPIPLARQQIIHFQYKEDETTRRWVIQDGKPLVLESELFDTILRYMRRIDRHSRDYLFEQIGAHVHGVQLKDVLHAIRVWQDMGLGNLKVDDDTLWGGIPMAPGKHTGSETMILMLIYPSIPSSPSYRAS